MDIQKRNQAIMFYNRAGEVAATDKQFGYRLFCSSVDIDPTFPEGWYAIGNANGDMNLREGSIAAFRRALESDPNNSNFWTNLGHKLYHVGEIKEAKQATKRALEINRDDAYATCNLSLIYSTMGDNEKALELAKKAHDLKSDDATIQIQLGFAYLFMRNWAEGLKWFEARFPYRMPHYLSIPYPHWRGEDISDKTLFLVAEMGMGDTLSFMRFLPAVAARAKVVRLHVNHELLRVVASMLAAHDIQNVEVAPVGPTIPAADYWLSTTSMPVALGMTSAEIAAAKQMVVPLAGLADRPAWKATDRKLHIGICWGGSPANDIDRWRSCEVTRFLDLYKVPGIQLYSLQVGGRSAELHNAGCAALIRDLSGYIHDVMDTMAIIRDLDLIITVETSLGHIAGAINADCWIVHAYNGGDWRTGRKGSSSLWYPRHRIFRQDEDAQWGPVFDRVVKALWERVT